MVPGLQHWSPRRRRRAGVPAHVDRNLILGMGIENDDEIVGLKVWAKPLTAFCCSAVSALTYR